MKLLVVDDDPRLREALEVGVQLQWQDAQVVAAADGEAGLDMFYEHLPDVVQMDRFSVLAHASFILRAAELARVVDVPELSQSNLASAGGCVAVTLELRGAHGEVKLKLLVHVGRSSTREPEAQRRAVTLRRHRAYSLRRISAG